MKKYLLTMTLFIVCLCFSGCVVEMELWVENNGGGKGNIKLIGAPMVSPDEFRSKLLGKGFTVESIDQQVPGNMVARIRWNDFNKSLGNRRFVDNTHILLDFGNVEMGSITAHVNGRIVQEKTTGKLRDATTVVFESGRARLVYLPNKEASIPLYAIVGCGFAIVVIIMIITTRRPKATQESNNMPTTSLSMQSHSEVNRMKLESNARFCTYCGAEQFPEHQFCTRCGKKRAVSADGAGIEPRSIQGDELPEEQPEIPDEKKDLSRSHVVTGSGSASLPNAQLDISPPLEKPEKPQRRSPISSAIVGGVVGAMVVAFIGFYMIKKPGLITRLYEQVVEPTKVATDSPPTTPQAPISRQETGNISTAVPTISDDKFKSNTEWRGMFSQAGYEPYVMIMSVEERKGTSVSGILHWPSLNDSKVRFKGELGRNRISFTSYELIQGGGVAINTNFDGDIFGDTIKGTWKNNSLGQQDNFYLVLQ